MFEHWRRYPWVLPEFLYENPTHLIDHLEEKVILPATTRLQWMSPQASLAEAMREIEYLKRQLAKLQEDSPSRRVSGEHVLNLMCPPWTGGSETPAQQVVAGDARTAASCFASIVSARP